MSLNTFKRASGYALNRAFAVLWGGAVAVGFYLAIIVFGPQIESHFLPVIEDYKLTQLDVPTLVEKESNGVVFVPEFTKSRDCFYLGNAWYANSSDGVPIRVQAQYPYRDLAPQTGPSGRRRGELTMLLLPEGTASFYGFMFHDCGLPWQTMSLIGPFRSWTSKPPAGQVERSLDLLNTPK